MKVWKKIIFVVITILLLNLTLVTSYEQAKASVVSKPLTITAKKVAKDLASDAAVQMANDIVSQYLVRELIDGVSVDSGYSAVCMDGGKQNINDCAPEKRAQMKNLTTGDRNFLNDKVEEVLERKTNTSAKWQKFLDFFVPLFLVSGVVSFFSAQLDGDNESFIDEIAKEALIDSGFLKPLTVQGDTQPVELFDFNQYVSSATITPSTISDEFKSAITLEMFLKPDKTFNFTYQHSAHLIDSIAINKLKVEMHYFGVGYPMGTKPETYRAETWLSTFKLNDSLKSARQTNAKIWTSGAITYTDINEAKTIGMQQGLNQNMSKISSSDNLNEVINSYFRMAQPISVFTFQIPTVAPVPLETDYGSPKGVEGTKNPDGTNNFKGIDSFVYIFNDTHIYPTDDSTTGWKDKTTGEDVTVIEDEIIVEEKTPPPTDPDGTEDEENGETPLACSRDLKNIEFKKVGRAFTTAFPFSIPWDIKRFIDNSFGGVGSEKPSFNLSFLGDGVTLTVPDYFDRWLPFVHGLLIILFDLSLIYLFYRFMKGGGD